MFRFFGQYVPVKSAILVLSEMALIVSSIVLATWVRLEDPVEFVTYTKADYFVLKICLIVCVCFVCFYYNDLYDLRAVSRRWELVIRLAQALGVACLIVALLSYAVPQAVLGRGIFALAAVIGGTGLIGWRLLIDVSTSFFRPEQRILVAGTGDEGIRLVREILLHPELNFRVVGFLDETGQDIGKSLVNPGIIGAVAELEACVSSEKVDRVVLAFTERRGQMPLRHLLRLKLAGRVRIEDAYSLYEKLSGRIMLDGLSPSWLILSEGFRKSPLQRIIKRASDVVIASVGLIVCLPLLAFISLAIYLESGSPILFRQRRIGFKRREFQMLKFRSMKVQATEAGEVWATEADPRITRVGRLLRRYRLDEIPQFINVFRGEMSIVGPRPEQPGIVEMLEAEIPYYPERHSVRPGITGWAQIRFKYGGSMEEAKTKLEYDFFYIKHMSPLFDLIIAFQTIQVMLFGQGAV